ncbi:response regulator [Gilvimarinus xylanilyticus]|uniref:histidine kinase n=1 Tax=Gilvimarinus xylanilyticus TaxID=2944139 RepID=A0A9X2I2I0_9GAMM|nr:response regulator [Gilvimarinus xylanilyticus]MCP8898896.1 response regulator [Gilvimarinus xylanilyticus]
MKKNSVKTELWRLILLPAISITLLLSATLTFLYLGSLDRFVDQRGRALAEKTAHLAYIAIRHHNPELLQQLLLSTLEEPMIRAIHVEDEQNQLSQHFGPRFLPVQKEAPPHAGQAKAAYTNYSARFSYPIVKGDGTDPQGILELELVLSSYWVTIYQTLLIVVIATIACLILAGLFALKLHGNIVRPISLLSDAIRSLCEGHLHTRVKGEFAYEFEQLAQHVNALAATEEQAQNDIQVHIEQSMEDLRETLETIEIQNIELDMARKEALTASQIKSEFLANTSHEIRTPLNGIIGFSNLALKSPLNDTQRGYVQTIHDSAQNLLTVINDILDFSKIESGKIELDYVPLPLRQVVEAAVDNVSPQAREKNLQILMIVDKNIPPQLMGDPLRLTQILTNLLNNAIKFSERGTITVEFKLERFSENRVTVKGCVSDEGIGLSDAQQSQLFAAFSQADTSTSREHGGTGLGLAICKGLVNRMNGQVGVDSQQDRGATFWFTADLGVDPHYAASDELYFKRKRFLICATIDNGYRQLANLAEGWGADCHRINSIHDAFTALRSKQHSGESYELILLDVAPDERQLPPALLDNLAGQFASEFSCKLIVCCTATHKALFSEHVTDTSLEILAKPLAQEPLLQAICRTLDIDLHHPTTFPQTSQEKPCRVLLVDDNEANLQLTTEFLTDLGAEVTPAKSGEQALEKFTEQTFDIVLMDIQMPGMDGLQTTAKLRAMENTEHRTPVVALTAHSMTEQKTELLLAGMDDCIRKPVSEEQLAHTLSRWTRLHQPQAINEPRFPTTPPTPQNHSSGPVNLSQCLSLANQKVELAEDMLRMLIDSLSDEKKKINDAFKAQNWAQLQEQIHKLYGSSCYTGVPHLRSLAGLIDKTLQARETDALGHMLTSLNTAIDQLIDWGKQNDIRACLR